MSELENLATDILEEDFVKSFAPFLIYQWLMGTIRVEIKNRFVTNSTYFQIIYSYIFSMCVTSSALYYDKFYLNYFHNYPTLYTIHSIGNFVQFFCSFCNIMHVKLFRPNDNIKFYLVLQNIDRNLHLHGQKSLYNRQYKLNLIAVITVSMAYMTCFSIHIFINVDKPLLTLFLGLAITSLHVEIFAMASAVYFLATRIRYLNQFLNLHLNKEEYLKPTGYNFLLKLFWSDTSLADTAASVECKEVNYENIVASFKFIVEGFKIICEVFSFQVVMLFGAIYLSTLVVIEGIALGFHTKWMSIETAVTMIIIWILFYVIAVIILAIVCELCVMQVQHTKRLCTDILLRNHEGKVYDTAKALLRLIIWHSPKFSVYGVITVDLSLPINLLRLVATNTIVLLQFTFL